VTRPVCLVTGATGAIGPGVVNALAGAFDIRTFSRRAPNPALFRVPLTPFAGEISDVRAVRLAASGVQVIVHLAALAHAINPPSTTLPEYERVNVEGTRVVIDAAQTERVSRVVVMSTIAVYGGHGRTLLDEGSPTNPDTFYGETKLAAERVALNARTANGAPLATVLRSAAVYGPRVKGNYLRLVRALARRRFVPIGPGDNVRTLVFEDDLAAATVLAATNAAAGGRIYNVSDGNTHRLGEIIAAICAALGRRPPRWHAPVGPARAALRIASVVDRRLPGMLDKYLEEIAVDGSRMQRELGFRPSTRLIEGWKATVDEMKRSGTI
jgi:nucleoside-diphosphate-sugar epimerase